MATEPKRQEPNFPPQNPDIQPEPRPEEIPQDKDFPEKDAPPVQLSGNRFTKATFLPKDSPRQGINMLGCLYHGRLLT